VIENPDEIQAFLGHAPDIELLGPLRGVAQDGPQRPHPGPAVHPDITFSSTVMFLKSRKFWNVRAMPRRVMRWGLSLMMDSPLKVMSPSFAR